MIIKELNEDSDRDSDDKDSIYTDKASNSNNQSDSSIDGFNI